MDESGDLPEPTRRVGDHVMSGMKAVFSSLPFAGGLASLIADYVPSSTQRAVWKAIEYLHDRLRALGDRIDSSRVDPDEFSDSVKSFLILSQRTSRDDKLRAAANLLANLLLQEGDPAKLNYTELDHFWRCLDSLSVGAIHLLGLVHKRAKIGNPRRSPGGEIMFTTGDIVPLMGELEPHTVVSLMAELNAWNLLRTEAAGASLASKGYRENDSVFLTPVGTHFVETVLQAHAGVG